MLSEKLQTQVDVGRIDLGFFNRLTIDDVVIHDREMVEMLRASRLSVKIELLPLLEGQVRIASAQIFGAKVQLIKPSEEAPCNYQFLIDALSSNDSTKKSSLDLRINSLIIRHSQVSWDRKYIQSNNGTVDGNHLTFSDISAYIILKSLKQDSLNLNIKRMAFREQSGLKVDRLCLRLEGNRNGVQLHGLNLQMPDTHVIVDSLSASYRLESIASTLHYKGSIAAPKLALPDLAFLYPRLAEIDVPMSFNAHIEGTANSISQAVLDLHSIDHDIELLSTFSASNLKENAIWSVQNYTLAIAGDRFDDIRHAIPNLPNILTRLGDVRISGRANGMPSGDIATHSIIHTDLGQVDALFTMTSDWRFNGQLSVDSLHLGRLLDQNNLGKVSTDLHLSGNHQSVILQGTASRFEFKGYPYQNIALDATWHNDHIAGKLKIDDPNIQTDVEGEWRRSDRSAIRLTGVIRNFAPAALHLSDKWGDAVFSAIIDADFKASTLADAEGSIDLDDFFMSTSESSQTEYHLDNLHLKSGYADNSHYMHMNGDFGEMNIEGQFDWATLPQSFINIAASKLPTLPGIPKTVKTTANNFEANIRLTDAEWLQRLFNIPLSLEKPLMMNIMIDDADLRLDMNGRLPSFSYDGSPYHGGEVNLNVLGDTARCDISLTKQMSNNRKMDLRIDAQAADNRLQSSFYWDNMALSDDTGDETMSGVINTITQLYTNDEGKSEAHVRVQPSRVNIKGTEWELEPSDILYSNKRLLVDHFNLRHGEQHLIVDGIASQLDTDSLMIDLNGIEVAYVLDLINFHAVDFGGQATGKAYITQAFDKMNAWADLEVASFTFMDGHMGTLVAHADWSQDDKQVDIDAFADDGAEAQTFIEGFIAPARNDIDLFIRARGTNIDFVNSFTNSFLENVAGQANGDLHLIGPLSNVDMTGGLTISGKATVSALNTTYQMRGDSITFLPGDIQFHRHRIYDRNNHTGYITGGLHHSNFKNFTFDIDIEAENLLAYDFPHFNNSTICGTVWANGHADLHGQPGEVVINCNVTPTRGSSFSYNAANPDAISSQQFITWRQKSIPDSIGVLSDILSPVDLKPQDRSDIPSDIYINFIINTTPDATLRVLMDQQSGDYITLNGTGTLSASFYNKGPFQMFGTYNVTRGTYGITIQNIIKKNFIFQDGGSIVFGGDPYDAQLNLKAAYTVNGVSLSDLQLGNSFSSNTVRVNCLMNINGTPESIRVEFDLEMPTVNSEEEQMIRSIIASEQELNQQVVYLLGIGRFYTQGMNNADAQQYGQTELAMQSLLSGTVSTQINELLSQVIKNEEWNFGANISTGNEGWHNAEYEGMISGRMLNNRLLVNGQFGYRDNATQATPSFIGDFDLRYLLTPSGNLALKVYNQTNDRYFTRSSLNTQGIGIIMKKDFNGLGDLFHSKRKKK